MDRDEIRGIAWVAMDNVRGIGVTRNDYADAVADALAPKVAEMRACLLKMMKEECFFAAECRCDGEMMVDGASCRCERKIRALYGLEIPL